MPIIRTISGSLVHSITGSLDVTSITGSLRGTASFSATTGYVANNSYIGDPVNGTRIVQNISAVTGADTSSLIQLVSASASSPEYLQETFWAYSLRTDIIGTHSGSLQRIIGGTLQANAIEYTGGAGLSMVGSITQIKNTNISSAPEFTYRITTSNSIAYLELAATGVSGSTTPVTWTSVTYIIKSPMDTGIIP